MSAEEPFRSLFQGADPNDTRFQFDIIKGLSESIRDLARSMTDMQRTQVGMLERLATLEANKVGEAVLALKVDLDEADKSIKVLMRDKDRRDGATGVFGFFLKYGPVIFSAFAAVWLFGRSLGVVPAPPAPVPATVPVQERARPEIKEVPSVH